MFGESQIYFEKFDCKKSFLVVNIGDLSINSKIGTAMINTVLEGILLRI